MGVRHGKLNLIITTKRNPRTLKIEYGKWCKMFNEKLREDIGIFPIANIISGKQI